jgi:hypothetical protein
MYHFPVQKVSQGVEHQTRLCTNDHFYACNLHRLYVTVSPTLIFNEGRQRLNGNVGYRVIEANIRELLHNPSGELSWC